MTSEMTRPTDDEVEAMAKYHDWRNAEIDAILAALEPAPDHSEWNAAIEAAVDKLNIYGDLGGMEIVLSLKKGMERPHD